MVVGYQRKVGGGGTKEAKGSRGPNFRYKINNPENIMHSTGTTVNNAVLYM